MESLSLKVLEFSDENTELQDENEELIDQVGKTRRRIRQLAIENAKLSRP